MLPGYPGPCSAPALGVSKLIWINTTLNIESELRDEKNFRSVISILTSSYQGICYQTEDLEYSWNQSGCISELLYISIYRENLQGLNIWNMLIQFYTKFGIGEVSGKF